MTDEQQGNGRQYPDTTTLWGCDPPDLGSYIGPEAQKSPYWTGTEAGIPHMGEVYRTETPLNNLEVKAKEGPGSVKAVDVHEVVREQVA